LTEPVLTEPEDLPDDDDETDAAHAQGCTDTEIACRREALEDLAGEMEEDVPAVLGEIHAALTELEKGLAGWPFLETIAGRLKGADDFVAAQVKTLRDALDEDEAIPSPELLREVGQALTSISAENGDLHAVIVWLEAADEELHASTLARLLGRCEGVKDQVNRYASRLETEAERAEQLQAEDDGGAA